MVTSFFSSTGLTAEEQDSIASSIAEAEAAKEAAEAAQAASEAAQAAAETAETNAETAEANASNSSSNASTSASNASSSAAAASSSATDASTAKTGAETARSGAETAQAAAETAETNAETAASQASTSATSAAQSATSAASSASSASTTYNNFRSIYLGSLTSDPTVDGNGDAVTAGDLYYNSTTGILNYYDGSAWVTISDVGPGFTGGSYNSSTGVITFTSDDGLGFSTDDLRGANTLSGILTGGNTTGGSDIAFGDNDKATFGAGSDLQIYHSGTGSYISDQGVGPLNLLSGGVRLKDTTDTETMLVANANGAVTLYYDNAAKLATTSSGVEVDGTLSTTNGTDISMDGSASGHLQLDGAGYAFGIALDTSGANIYTNSISRDLIFGVNETEVMRVTDSNLGIGTSSPTAPLHAYNATTNVVGKFESGDAAVYVTLADSDSTSNTANRIGVTGNDLHFWTGATEALRIDSSQRVGLGLTSPTSKLHLGGFSGAVDGTKGIQLSNDVGTAALFEVGGSSDSYIGTSSASDFSIRTNDTARLTIKSGGNVGINTDSAAGDLDVTGRGGGNGEVYIQRTSGASLRAQAQSALGTFGTTTNHSLQFITNGNGQVTIATDGDTGIGTTSPAFRIHGYHPTSNVIARFESGDGEVWIDLHDSNSGSYGALLGHNSTDLFKVADANVTTRLSLSNSGDLSVNSVAVGSSANDPVLGISASGNVLKITSPTGYTEIGSKNSSWSHFYTDRGQFYFGSPVVVDGNLAPYTDSQRTLGTSSDRWSVLYTDAINMNGQLDMNNSDIVGVDQIIHEGDTNTYIQFHAADQFRVVTGGSERFEVNNTRTQADNFECAGTISGGKIAPVMTGSISTAPVGSYAIIYSNYPNNSTYISPISGTHNAASVNMRVYRYNGGYSYTTINYGTWRFMGRGYAQYDVLVQRIS